MGDFNMSRLILSKDGYYRDLNGNKVAKKGQALSGDAWKYLANKYGKEYANRASMNTRNGNIFQNNKWRFNDIQSDKEGRTATWEEANSRIKENSEAAGGKRDKYGYYQINPFTGKTTYLNQDVKDKVINITKKDKSTEEDEPSFSWSDWNPFNKKNWEGNWDDAIENAKNSFLNAGYYNIINSANRALNSYKSKGFWGGTDDLISNVVGTVSKSALDLLGGTVGTGIQLILPKKWENSVGIIGSYLDPGKDLNSIRTLLTPGEKFILPHEAENQGLADEGFSWLLGSKEQRQDLDNTLNLAAAIFGTKGVKAGLGAVKSGVKSAATKGVVNTIKSNKSNIAKHIPGVSNAQLGMQGAQKLYQGLAPKSWGGQSGTWNRTKNIATGGFQTSLAFMPDAALWPYYHSGYIMNLGKNNNNNNNNNK